MQVAARVEGTKEREETEGMVEEERKHQIEVHQNLWFLSHHPLSRTRLGEGGTTDLDLGLYCSNNEV